MPSMGRLRYLDVAPGTPREIGTLVLIHGFPLNASMWEPQLSLSGLGWRVVVPTLRGFDGGSADSTVLSMDDFAADVIDLLDALGIEEAVIGGLSMGGYVAFAMYRLAHRYFGGLILADTRAEADTPDALAARQRSIDLVTAEGPAAIADDMMPRLLGDTTRRTQPAIEAHVRSMILSNSSRAIAGALGAIMRRPDSTPLLSSIHCPTLVIAGEEDTLTPPALSQGLHQAIGGSTLSLVPQAGHLANLEQPDAFNRAVGMFLSRNF
jgi:pimeloyl-ACP methyl ester carboxylesterase